jgi:4'-phosphopantetheinyl transferase
LTKTLLPLPDGEAHVWLASTEEAYPSSLLAQFERLLCPEETARRARFRFLVDRRRYLLGHALVRTVLSAYSDVDPTDWRFVRNEFGRPEPVLNAQQSLRCNLSGTLGLVACVITRVADAGIDVEDVARLADPMDLARHAFAPHEVEELESLGGEQQRFRFFEYWTLKEAYLKARGVGLSGQLSQAGFRFKTDVLPTLSSASEAAHWQFQLSRPTPEHLLAVAVRKELEEPFRIVERWGFPLIA